MTRKAIIATLALICIAGPAYAAEVATKGDTAVILPYGDYVVAFLQAVEPAAVTILTTLIGVFLTSVFPMARLFLSNSLVEATLHKWLDFGFNQIEGAAKGKSLNVETGSAVLSASVNRAIDRAEVSKEGKVLLDKAGGVAEVANKLFRLMNLDQGASGQVLQQVLADLKAAGHIA